MPRLAHATRDLLPAAVFVAIGQLDAWNVIDDRAGGHPRGPAGIAALLLLFGTAPLALRRRAPLPAALLMALSVAVQAAAMQRVYTLGGLVPMLVVVFSLAAHERDDRRRIAGLGATVAAGWTATAVVPDLRHPTGFAFDALVLGLAFGVGWLVRNRNERTEGLVALTRALERERDQQARIAVAEEQARIARELHDVIAHAVSVIVIQAGAAEQVVGDNEVVRAALESIRRTGGEALGELRRLVGIIRDRDETLTLAPQPGIAALDTLVDSARASGADVELSIDGARRPLQPGLELAVYRIVQESLTNVQRHSPGAPAQVELTYGERQLVVAVENEASPRASSGGGGGHGLIGMQERAALYGGTLEAGPLAGGGFRVRVTLPAAGDATS